MSAHHIISTYTTLLTGCVLVSSYIHNKQYINNEIGSTENSWTQDLSSLFANIFIQLAASFVYNIFRESQKFSGPSERNMMLEFPPFAVYFLMFQPIIWQLVGLPLEYLNLIPIISFSLLCAEYVLHIAVNGKRVYFLFSEVYHYSKYTVQHFGVQAFMETHWNRIKVPDCFRLLWITRTLFHTIHYFYQKNEVEFMRAFSEESIFGRSMNVVLLQLVYGCDTMVALIGMTCVISYIAHYVGLGLAVFLRSQDEDDRNMGTMSAILFYILGLQTGLTSLEQDQRLARLLKNFCLLSTAILHYTHSMVNPQLLNLSASHRSFSFHWRPLALCSVLVTIPSIFLYYLWSHYSISTWLLAVTAFSIEVILKVLISLIVYSLFLIDAYRQRFWEQLDDYVYYIQAVGNTIEFLFGIFLFCNGGWIMLFESGGTIRAIMMCIHAYFNIWVQARDGWKAFMLRRTAVQKITSLREATADELREHNDVCAICYQELQSARVTRCKHLFHGVCLRKWLYVRDECPLCHQLIIISQQPPPPPPPPQQEEQPQQLD